MKKRKLFRALLAGLIAITILATTSSEFVIAANEYTMFTSNTNSTGTLMFPVFSNPTYNDVCIPLPEYDAEADTDGYIELPALSHFKDNNGNCLYYGGSRQCDGFARYAFDRFWHIEDSTRKYASWTTASGTTTADYHPKDTSGDYTSAQWTAFFNNLSIGSVVRYVKSTDTTPSDGSHTILFMGVASDGGILAYECNQDVFHPDATATDHCGVFYQKYTIEKINERYAYVLYYVEHDLSTPVPEDRTYHTVSCVNCDGYLRQTHTDTSPTIRQGTAARHTCIYDCCGSIADFHTYQNMGTYLICTVCGYRNNTSINRNDEALLEE